jgi:hypothetical protein
MTLTNFVLPAALALVGTLCAADIGVAPGLNRFSTTLCDQLAAVDRGNLVFSR